MRLTPLKVVLAILGMVGCLIPYLALTEEYSSQSSAEPGVGRVVEIDGERLIYQVYDEPRDGRPGKWSNNRRSDDLPQEVLQRLEPGVEIVTRRGVPEASLSRPTPLLLVGALFCALLGVWTVVAARRDRRILAEVEGNPLRLIEFMVGKTLKNKTVAGVLLFLMGVGIISTVFFADGETWELWFIVGIGLIALAVAAHSASAAYALRNPKQAPILRAIRDTPECIVWIYEQVLTVNGVPAHTIFVCCEDGKKLDFNLMQLPTQSLMHTLASMLPHATIGYDREREAAFQRDPASLRVTEHARELVTSG